MFIISPRNSAIFPLCVNFTPVWNETNGVAFGYRGMMKTKQASSGLKALSLVYLASASLFGLTIAVQSDPQWSGRAQAAAKVVGPVLADLAEVANRNAVQPAKTWALRENQAFFDWLSQHVPHPAVAASTAPHKVAAVQPPKPAPVAAQPAPASPPVLRPSVGEEPNKEIASAPPPAPPLELAGPQAAPPNLSPAPDANPPTPAELSRVMQHMKVSLTKELYENFSLFLYVSKADRGPWAQRMYVFQKQPSGDLTMLYNWPVSTGRELIEMAPSGSTAPSYTPQGYYEIDPDRVYKRYRSMQWDQSMPYAMFFNWEHDGLQTGLAIHGATGTDIALLGKRSSAGCVRIDPQNAQLLYRLIRTDYKGLAPRFAYDRRTATMSNDGLLMHDKAGNLQYVEGYKVLVFIENNGGDNVIAAIF